MAAIKIIKPCPCDIVKPIAGLFLQEDETIFTDYSSVTFSAIYPITSDNAKIALQPVGNIKVGDRVKLGGGTYPTDVFTVGSIELKAGVLSVILDTPFIEGGGMPSAETAAKIDHNLIVKTTNSEHDGIDISNHSDYLYTHNFIIDGTITFDVSAVGGASVVVSSDSFTNSEVAEIQNITSGTMSSTSGYVINEYQLLYKLVLWGYINHSYTRTVRPYISINEIQNTNNATEAINYKLPCSTITANKAALTMTTDCLAVIWSDGAVLDNEGTETQISGAGSGDFYLFGDYTKLVASNQSISNVDVLSDNLRYLDLSSNAVNINDAKLADVYLIELNLDNSSSFVSSSIAKMTELVKLSLNNCVNSAIIQSYFDNVSGLTYIDLSNTDSNITDITKYALLTYLNLHNTNSIITSVSNNTLLAYLNLHNTNSTITSVSNNTLLTHLFLINTNSTITSVSNNTLLINLNLHNTNSTITSVSNNTLLTHLFLANTNSTITSVSNNTLLITLNLANTNSTITEVRNLCRYIRVDNTDNTAANNNTLIQNLIDNPRNGIKELTFTAHADIDQSNVTLLVNAGWDIEQI
jgi:hypothetical protein